jgi:propionyl-CoA carboxylase alpha chain
VPHDSPEFLLSLAAAAHFRMRDLAATIGGQLPGHRPHAREQFAVVTTAPEGTRHSVPVTVVKDGAALNVTVADRRHRITLDGELRDLVVRGEFDGLPFVAQIERRDLEWRIAHNGVVATLRVLSPRAAQLLELMPVKSPPDLSKFLLSPMPGLLVDVSVQGGQTVQAGERLAAIEAMKMENILFASQDCVVEEVVAKKGDSLAVDQVILRFK